MGSWRFRALLFLNGAVMCCFLRCGRALQTGDTEAKAQGQEINQMATYIMECGGMERIEQLQMHDNNNIYNKALKLLERYFGVEDEEDNGIAPLEAEGAQQFAFGQPTQAGTDTTFGAQPNQGGFNFG